MRGLIFVARIFYHLTYIIIDIGILLILNRFTDSFLGFFNFNEAYDTILTEQEQCTDPLMFSFPHKVMVCYIFFSVRPIQPKYSAEYHPIWTVFF